MNESDDKKKNNETVSGESVIIIVINYISYLVYMQLIDTSL